MSINHTLTESKFKQSIKNMVDDYGGVLALAARFDWSVSTIYKWIDGKKMSMTYAICISEDNPKFNVNDFLDYELTSDKTYFKIITYFGSQSAAAEALGVSQYTVSSWLKGNFNIRLDKAERLAELTSGFIQPSDFKHLKFVEVN